MARFFLRLHECGSLSDDEEGTELPDLAAARAAALTSAREVMCAEVQAGRLCLACFISIADADGVEIDRLLFKDAIAITGL